LTLFFIPAWPRFELTHIQPAIALAIFFFAKNNKSPGHSERSEESLSLSESRIRERSFGMLRMTTEQVLLIILFILSIRKITTVYYGNFYLNPETQEVSSFLKQQEQNQLFVLGGSDLIYPLSGKTPAGNYYLPSLPWYYSNQKFVSHQLNVLSSNPQSLVVINQNSTVDGLPMQTFAMPVYGYILENYTVFHTVGSYQIYKINQ